MNYKKTFVLGLGFFVISLTWPLYNTFVPIFLNKYITSATLIGFIMTLDNIAAITLQPYFGAKSDSTRTKYGRRMPYLLIGIPLSAVFFSMIPFHLVIEEISDLSYTIFNWEVTLGFIFLIFIVTCFNLSMSIYRAPTVALMPDITPLKERSKANGIINFMGGFGAVFALFAGGKMFAVKAGLPFTVSAILMLFVIFVLYKTVKEPEKLKTDEKEEKQSISKALVGLFKRENRSALLILLAIFFWFVGYQGIEATFSLYGVNFLGLAEHQPALLLAGFSAAFLLMAIPSGLIGTKIGKRNTILIGIIGLMSVFLILNYVETILLLRIFLIVGGIFWAFVNINSYPMVVELTTEEKIGTYTGLYYFFSSLAAITGPVIFGLIIDIVGYKHLFFTAFSAFFLAFLCIYLVKNPSLGSTSDIGSTDEVATI
ncbi:SLC45 family MFS transporter [Alkalicella caledoniensis]|uniref:SLC45 family MFS transporter n=1 Tax=Alkalicella caledoniensis TaxID=2731377 RepID=A0A7G9WA84_ALKCA|nr:MFS transporter [Alkalicella caledoniensis]QNO15596.1 SLC45 family MFS transporter [Alkalicella caledoniensis]